MRIGIHPDQIGEESYSKKWTQFLVTRGIDVKPLNLLSHDALQQVSDCDGVMWRWGHNPQEKQSAQRILYTIQCYSGIPVYPDQNTAWHYDEKIAQYYLLQAIEAPVPKTWLFWGSDQALQWAETAAYPVICKLSAGASSSAVFKVANREQAKDVIYQLFHTGIFPDSFELAGESSERFFKRTLRPGYSERLRSGLKYFLYGDYPRLHPVLWKPEFGYIYFQEFLHENSFDTRITVIGERAFGFRRLNRPGDFRASGSGLIDYDRAGIDFRCVKLAFHISKRCGFQSMAYDFLLRGKEPVVVELSYAYADNAVYDCPGHWKPDLTWVDGHMWPEEAQVEDFVSKIERSKKGMYEQSIPGEV